MVINYTKVTPHGVSILLLYIDNLLLGLLEEGFFDRVGHYISSPVEYNR